MTKQLIILGFFCGLMAFGFSAQAKDKSEEESTQYHCHTELEYEWKRNGDEKAEHVPWGRFESVADSEEQAKKELAEVVSREKTQAREACQKDHENLSGCIAAKFRSMATVLKRLSFSARKALEAAITDDCKARQGKCREVKAGETHCAGPPVVEEEGEKEESDKKKKKKKK